MVFVVFLSFLPISVILAAYLKVISFDLFCAKSDAPGIIADVVFYSTRLRKADGKTGCGGRRLGWSKCTVHNTTLNLSQKYLDTTFDSWFGMILNNDILASLTMEYADQRGYFTGFRLEISTGAAAVEKVRGRTGAPTLAPLGWEKQH